MGGDSALFHLTLFAVTFFHQRAEGCLNNSSECSKNVTVRYHLTETGNFLEAGEKVCKNGSMIKMYPAVVGGIDEMCILKQQMVKHSVEITSIEFNRNISTPLFSTNTSFLGISLNLPSSNWSGECLALRLNGTYNRGPHFHWELQDCHNRDSGAKFCMEENRPYWNASGTNNVLPGLQM